MSRQVMIFLLLYSIHNIMGSYDLPKSSSEKKIDRQTGEFRILMTMTKYEPFKYDAKLFKNTF